MKNWQTVIKRIRRHGGMSQSAIARHVRVTQPYISQLEGGSRSDPPYSVGVALLELARQYDPRHAARDE